MATGTPEQQAIGKLVTDAVAAVLDERTQASTDPSEHAFLASLTDRLATQFHNVPGYDPAEFQARAHKGELEKAAASAASATKPSASSASAPAPAKFDAAEAHRRLVAAQQSASRH